MNRKHRNNPLKSLSLFVFFTILVSCSAKLQKPEVSESLVIFPSPPDTTRIQFLTSFTNSKDVTGNRAGLKKYVMGEDKANSIVKPYGLAVHKGKIYVCDTILGGLEILDLENKEFKYFTPDGLGKLKKPINCAVDSDGKLFVADAGRRQIVVFDENGKYLTCFGDANTIKPTDIFITADRLWVADMNNHKVRVYAKDTYELISSIPDVEPDAAGFLRKPTNLWVLEDRVYVSDFGDFNIKIYSTAGVFIRAIGSYGNGLGQFTRPKGVAVDKSSNLFVVDSGFENVQVFNPADKLLMFFGGTYKGPGYMWLPAKVVIDYDNLEYFRDYVHESFSLKYLIFVSNQYGPDKINVYGYVGPEHGPVSKEKLTRKVN